MRHSRLAAAVLVLVSGAGVVAMVASTPVCTDCLKTRYWPIPSADAAPQSPENFPEIEDSNQSAEAERLRAVPSVGVAFSGGGTRAATAALGQLRGMRENGWLSQVRYVSAVSGGAWAAIPFTYSKVPIATLLGTFQPPAKLVADDVRCEPNGLMAKAIADSSLTAGSIREASLILASIKSRDSADNLLGHVNALLGRFRPDGVRFSKTYARLLADVFIDPLIEPGTKTSDRLFAWDGESVGNMTETNPGQLGGFVVAQSERPFLIAGGTMVVNRPEYDFPSLMPVEYTPLYVGARQQFGGQYGGAYVWPWAYDPVGLVHAADDGTQPAPTLGVRIDRNRRFTLADVAASTGAAPELFTVTGGPLPAEYKPKVQMAAQFFPAFRHLGVRNGTPKLTDEIPHADGGGGDNLGVMPLLARGVRNIFVFINTNTHYAEENDDLQSLFFSVGPPTASGDKRYNRVFAKERWDQVKRGLAVARSRHAPQVYCDSGWDVQMNTHYNIRAYKGLSICFFYNAAAPQWEETLELPILKLLKQKPKTPASQEPDERKRWLASENQFNFPWFATFEQNKPHLIKLTTTEVNLLSHFTAWIVTNPDVVKNVHDTMPAIDRKGS